MNFYVLVLEEKVKSFSLVGSGNKCLVTLQYKGDIEPLEVLRPDDKVIGYVAGSLKMFSYLFNVGIDDESNIYFEKTFESENGAKLASLSKDIQELISGQEQINSFISITGEQYTNIVEAMLKALTKGNAFSLPWISMSQIDEKDRADDGGNFILYGVPGSGKSWTIEHDYCPKDSVVSRLVFHPDYTNADFIGQILPVVDKDKQVTYEFTPGPFTTIIRDAYQNPKVKYILIIEEINRGNAPAIFGEAFQLLDRLVEPATVDGIVYPKGTSEYGITNANMAEKIYGDPNHKVRIPSNLSIIATMNTSDQNVFTLDTAFQRRWHMRLIENSFDNVRESLAKAEILDTGVTWQKFCETINSLIINNKSKMASAEDKRLGVYFIHENDIDYKNGKVTIEHPTEPYPTLRREYNSLIKNPEADLSRLEAVRKSIRDISIFPEKVIKYLWDDAFKFNPDALFNVQGDNKLGSLEDVINVFVDSYGDKRFDVFKPEVRELLKQ